MGDLQLTPADDLRADVRRALATQSFDSVKIALGFTGAMVGVCAVVGGGLISLQRFSSGWFLALAMTAVVCGVIGFVVLELFRLSSRSRLLQGLIDAERYYDSLLRAAWAERDLAQATARQLQTRLDVVMTVREMLAPASDVTVSPVQKVQRPSEGEQDG